MDAVQVSRRRLTNLGLAGSDSGSPADVVRKLLAMQSQDYGPAKWAIAQRSRDLADPDIQQAVAEGSILRTHVLRPTWHFVAREDIGWLLQLTGPRIAKAIAPRLRELGLDGRTLTRAEERVAAALEGDRHLTREEIAEVLRSSRIDTAGQRLPYILMHCELTGLICSGRPDGNKQTFALLAERAPDAKPMDPESSRAELVRRYLAGHGPATVDDLRWWSSLTVRDIRAALDGLGNRLSSETFGDLTLWWLADGLEAAPEVEGAHMLQTYDEFIVGYRDSRFIGDERAVRAVAAWRDRSIPNGLVLIGGKIAGHWRRKLEPRRVGIEAALYVRPNRSAMELLGAEAEALGVFLGRPAELHVSTF